MKVPKVRLVHYLDLTPEDKAEMRLYGSITTGSGYGLRAVWEPVAPKPSQRVGRKKAGKK